MDLPAPVLRLQEALSRVGRALQRVVLTALLAVVYLVGVGLTRLLAPIVARRALDLFRAPDPDASMWREAEGYTAERARLKRQY